MYTEKERAKLLIQAATAVSTYPEVEGIVQVGSGVDGFGDHRCRRASFCMSF